MPTRSSRHVFINKDQVDFIIRRVDEWLKGAHWDPKHGRWLEAEQATDLLQRLKQSCSENRRFTIEVENCYEIVPPNQVFKRPVGYAEREKLPRGLSNAERRRAARLQGPVEGD